MFAIYAYPMRARAPRHCPTAQSVELLVRCCGLAVSHYTHFPSACCAYCCSPHFACMSSHPEAGRSSTHLIPATKTLARDISSVRRQSRCPLQLRICPSDCRAGNAVCVPHFTLPRPSNRLHLPSLLQVVLRPCVSRMRHARCARSCAMRRRPRSHVLPDRPTDPLTVVRFDCARTQ